MSSFKINQVEICDWKKENDKDSIDYGWIYVDIEFEYSNKDDEKCEFSFCELGKYSRAIYVPDRQKLEEFWEEESKYSFEETCEFEPAEDGRGSYLKWKRPSCYDLGLTKLVDIEGGDVISKVDGKINTFQYGQYVADCYITRAVLVQLVEMKNHIDEGFCRYGNYPSQNGAFRSGDPFSDFLGAIACLDKFWD